jgi:hypothetical protein
VRLCAVRCPATELPAGAPAGHRYHFTLLLGGAPVLDQEGGAARSGPGDLVLVDGGRPFRLALTAPRNTLVTAHLPAVPGDPLAAGKLKVDADTTRHLQTALNAGTF